MKLRYTLFKRGRVFYCEDTQTGKQFSLHTRDSGEAQTLLHSRNEATRQAHLNLRIAQTYLAASDPIFASRTWQTVMDEFTQAKQGKTRIRCERAAIEKPFDLIRGTKLIETCAEQFFRVLQAGSVSTNIYLRRYHNFALDLNWLPYPVIPRRQWPPVRHKEKRAITREEHERVLAREPHVELRAFYECCWHLGGAQTDIAQLKATDIDWKERVVSFFRIKTGSVQVVHFGPTLAEVLKSLPSEGNLFPWLSTLDEKTRAAYFQRILRRLKIEGVSLHSYRYSWAERAKVAGYPERFAQIALGHNSKAVHRAYARKAHVVLPALESFERRSEPIALITVANFTSAAD